MHRPIVYTQEQGRSTDFLFAAQQSMVGLSKLAKAILGSSTLAEGLAVTPTTPASLDVNVASGQIYQMEPLEASAYGILPADTTDTILKQGLAAAQTLSCPAPTTAGYSINYLIQATYQDVDAVPAVLPYFNSANPAQPLSGQNNSGAAQSTQRQGVCIVAVKAGAAATTGSQTTPAPDSGYVGLYVVTVAYGQTQITGSSIALYSGAPLLSSMLQMVQSGAFITASDTGTANAYAIALTPAPTALTPGMLVQIDAIVASNTGASTLNVNGLGALPIQSAGGVALQGGELVATYGALLRLNHAGTAWTLLQTTGGSLPVKAGTQSEHAVNFGQTLLSGALTNVTSSRVSGTTYTNSLTRPKIVRAYANSTNAAGTLSATVNGITFYGTTGYSTSTVSASIHFEVLPGNTYSINVPAGFTLTQWLET